LPAQLIARPKEGFVMPVNDWLLSGLRQFTDEVLSPSGVQRAGLLRPEAVAAVLRRFRGGESGLANRVLSLVALHVWWEDYLGAARTY
jgi:asparagine synthase (glutamine-hydrolysing)